MYLRTYIDINILYKDPPLINSIINIYIKLTTIY